MHLLRPCSWRLGHIKWGLNSIVPSTRITLSTFLAEASGPCEGYCTVDPPPALRKKKKKKASFWFNQSPLHLPPKSIPPLPDRPAWNAWLSCGDPGRTTPHLQSYTMGQPCRSMQIWRPQDSSANAHRIVRQPIKNTRGVLNMSSLSCWLTNNIAGKGQNVGMADSRYERYLICASFHFIYIKDKMCAIS